MTPFIIANLGWEYHPQRRWRSEQKYKENKGIIRMFLLPFSHDEDTSFP